MNMNHKRGRAKKRRAGCLLCKPWKRNGVNKAGAVGQRFSDYRRTSAAEADLRYYI